MNLLINISNNLAGGGLQVALSFLEECKNISNNAYHVFLGKNTSKQVNIDEFPNNFIFYQIPRLKIWQFQKILKSLEKQIKPDCVFTVFGPSYWKPRKPHLMGYARGYYIYSDYSYFKYASLLYNIKIKIKGMFRLLIFKNNADYFVTETEDAKNRLMKIMKTKKIYVVSNTCADHYYDYKNYANKLPERKSSEIRLITITGYYKHKNLESIPLVIYELKKRNIENIKFVLTLNNNDLKKVVPRECREYIYNIGPVPSIECPSLYKECDILYLPTLLEIFSASYPEAMAMEMPILTSDLGFAHSVCKNAALYFNPFSTKDIADKIELLINDNELKLKLINNGKMRLKNFGTAKDRAKKYLHICEEMMRV